MRKKTIYYCYSLFFVLILFFALPNSIQAQNAEEKLIEFFSDKATMEDDPNKGVYNITIFSPDGAWKMQLNYHAKEMFGTFTNTDFRLDGDGKYYNYARNPQNDMVFYSFTDMNVSVADEGSLYRVKANCLTNNKTRFIVEATIAAPKPQTTLTSHLGYTRITTNAFYGTYSFKAENDLYKLEYGIVSNTLLGTFYRADLLKPDLYDKKTGKYIEVSTATAIHTQAGDTTLMQIDILSTDLVLYSLSMYNCKYEIDIKVERNIDILSGTTLQDLTEMYGCYQFGGQNEQYAVAIAINPDAMESGKTEWTADDIFIPYTNLVELATETFVDIFDVNASLSQENNVYTLHANITSMEGILYHVRMVMSEGAAAPQVTDTVNIDFGHIAMLDYSMGMGTVGFIAARPDEYQIRFYLNAVNLEGNFINEDFLLDLCDIMVVNQQQGTYIFHDAQYVTGSMQVQDSTTYITIDMIGIDNVLYHTTMHLDSLKCMRDMEFPVSYTDNCQMMAIQEGSDGVSAEYTLQFQDMQHVYDKDMRIVGDGYAMSFYFGHSGLASIAGEYGYSAGTLADDEVHFFFEHGCEVRVAPLAGTLSITPVNPITLKIDLFTLHTYLYKIEFKWLGQNGAIYTGQGENYLICINQDDVFIDIKESDINSINESLAKQGFQVRKVFKDGKLLIEKLDKEYDLQGKEIKQ